MEMSLPSFVPGIATTVLLALTLRYLAKIVYNAYFHPLSSYPGPFLRGASSLPSLVEGWTGNSIQNVHALHQRYGTVVRVSPDALSFSNAQAWKDIYGFRQQKRQVPKDYKRFPPIEGVTPILYSNDVDHARMRKLMAHAFSEAALKEQQPLVASHMQTFIRQVKARSESSETREIDINEWFNYLAFDVVSDLCFGEPLGAIERGTPDPEIEGFFKSCRMFPIIPMVHESSLMHLLFQGLLRVPSIKRDQEMGYLVTTGKVERRMSYERRDKRDFMTYITRHNDEKGMTVPEIVGSTAVIVNAGGESTAGWMSAAVYYLLSNIEIYDRAKVEVRTAFKSSEDIMAGQLGQLTFLNAVLEEALRMYPPVPGNFSRRTNVDTEIDGFVVPPNTSVGVHQWSANHSPRNFTNPDSFIPDRWLRDAPTEYRNDIKDAMQPWTLGPRNCLGRNVAYLEARMVLALLFWLFDMELPSRSSGWADNQNYNIIWNRPPLYVRLLPRAS